MRAMRPGFKDMAALAVGPPFWGIPSTAPAGPRESAAAPAPGDFVTLP